MLWQGGNAIDAAAAALVVECVIAPYHVSLGGYGASLVFYHAKSGRVLAIDSTSRAARRFNPATFNESSGRRAYLALGVPGLMAGIDLALREYGRLPFKTIAAPGLALAENGTRVTPRLARSFEALRDMDPVSRRAFLPNGAPPVGSKWAQPDLARLIRRLGDEGPADFYRGEVAGAIVRQVQANAGDLTEQDFSDFRATVVEPLHVNFRGHDVYTPPLPSGGLTTLSILKTLEQFDLSDFAPLDASYIELFIGAARLGWQERKQFFGDPEFVDVPVDDLLSEKRAAARAKILRQGMAAGSSPHGGSSNTVNICVIDEEQNVVSWTATVGDEYGAHVAIEGLGLILGHSMSRFDLDPGSPNYPAAGKRPQHNMAPVVLLRDGEPYGAVGMPGGLRIVTVTGQIIANMFEFRPAPQQAIATPRFHTEDDESIQVAVDMPVQVMDELRRRGHKVEYRDPLGGDANVVVIDPATGHVQAAASKNSTGVMVF
jgi:gamma-glutamyltranspeptidase/glutathione hydrolase